MSEGVDLDRGVSPVRERRWGLIGGTLGSAFGVGSAIVAVAVDGAPFFDAGPYPDIFMRRELLALDLYLLLAIVVGAGFSTAAAIFAKRSPFPRTDGFGAALMGGLLTTLGGVILFVRVYALVSGS